MFPILFSCLSAVAVVVGQVKKTRWLTLVAMALVILSASFGIAFSPSYTAYFILAFLGLFTLAEAVSYLSLPQTYRQMLSAFLAMLGGMFVYPATLIYLHGDDTFYFLSVACFPIGALLFAVFAFFYLRKHAFKWTELPTYLALLILFIVAFLTIAAGVTSTALIPFGLGVTLCIVALICKKEYLTVCGMLVANVMLWAPMVC